ncbi:hypothetical protein Tco_1569718 [Tanacetum coccineum]
MIAIEVSDRVVFCFEDRGGGLLINIFYILNTANSTKELYCQKVSLQGNVLLLVEEVCYVNGQSDDMKDKECMESISEYLVLNLLHYHGKVLRRSVAFSSHVRLTYALPLLCHSEARSWSIPSEDPYEEAARQLLEQAPRSLEYVPDPIELEDHVPVYIPEPEHPEDLVPAEDEAPTPPLPPFFLSHVFNPQHTRAAR